MAELGERVANLEARLDAQSQDLAEIRESITHLDHRMEARFAALDSRFASIDARFVQMDTRFLQVEARLDSGFRDIREEIHSNFRWIMGGIGGAVLALLLALLSAVLVWAPRA
jgi:BMFP domain-containing protein YqiC